MARRLSIVVAVMALGAVFAAPAAHAEFGIASWQALTCAENEDSPATPNLPPLAQSPNQCTASTPSKFFTQAAGHPNWAVTDFTLNNAGGFPEGFVKDIVVESPEGLSVNPEATPQCTIDQLKVNKCPANTQVGTNYLTVSVSEPPCPCAQERVALPVYNMVPFEGVPSMVAFLTETGATFIVGSLDPVDQHVTFTITNVHPPSAGPPASPPIVGSRLVFDGQAGNGTYLTMPSNCAGGQTTKLKVDSYGPPYALESLSAEESFTTSVGGENCAAVPFEPTIAVTPQGGAVDSPEATTVNVGIPFDPTEPIANSYLKTAKVTLPEGMGINPSSANGLVACTDEEFHKGTNNEIECPEASKIGTVEVQTPSLPADSLGGTIYVGKPLSNNPSSGEQFRMFIYVTSARYGVNVRLIGKLFPNLNTGQLTAVIDENPQATFSSFKLRFNGGPNGTLTTPGICGPNTTTTQLTPWSGNADATPSGSFTLTSNPSGGSCPKTLAERPFAPSYTAASDSTKAGSYSPLRVHIGRPDGQQELKGVDVTLPPGLTGKLAGISYCSEAELSAAAASSGAAEQASPSCPAESMIGTTSTEAGTGTNPLKIAGKAYLAGPYKGAPLSMAVITPAVAGPYDLGTVVVRVALFVNPETAQIHAVSDPIPDVFGGVKLDLRAIDINLERSNFMRNPTNCSAFATTGTLSGGGADPTNPAAFSSYAVSAPYQATACNTLGFKPKLFTRLLGGRKTTYRAQHPQLRAILEAREGDANLSRAALTLPHALFLDQSHIMTVCTRPQLAAQECPSSSVYGQAEAKTPLLSAKLKGPVYLVSSGRKLPDLVADLRGQVNVQLHGVISSPSGGIKTVFNPVPDVPVSKFTLLMDGGKKGLLVNSTNLCKKPLSSVMNLKAQNGKKVTNHRLPLKVSGC